MTDDRSEGASRAMTSTREAGTTSTSRLPVDELRRLVGEALRRGGFSDRIAEPITATIVSSEIDGVPSHGLLRLPGFVEAVRSGWADGRTDPVVLDRTSTSLVVDALNGFAQPALSAVRDDVVERARRNGVAMLLTRNAHHFAALAPDIEPLAEAGLVALSCVNSRKRMNAWGGSQPVLGTNAMAFAAPRAGHRPLVWDQSSSIMSQGDLLLAAREGRSVPADVGQDREGRPTTSAREILDGGTLSPFGGSKGGSIAAMVEILAAALTGSPFGFENPDPPSPTAPSKGGQFLLVVDPARHGVDVASRVAALCGTILDGGSPRVPGDRRYRNRSEALRLGVPIDAATRSMLHELAR